MRKATETVSDYDIAHDETRIFIIQQVKGPGRLSSRKRASKPSNPSTAATVGCRRCYFDSRTGRHGSRRMPGLLRSSKIPGTRANRTHHATAPDRCGPGSEPRPIRRVDIEKENIRWHHIGDRIATRCSSRPARPMFDYPQCHPIPL